MKNLSLVGRDAEIQRLVELYDDPSTMMATIIGDSGSGKLVLAQEILTKVASTQGFLCSGKFDIQNHADPYQAIAAAIDDFIWKVSKDHIILSQIRESLQTTLGEDISVLSELVPSFKLLMGEEKVENNPRQLDQHAVGSSNKSTENAADRSIMERAARIQHVFVEFFRVVSTKEHPVTMLLDDI